MDRIYYFGALRPCVAEVAVERWGCERMLSFQKKKLAVVGLGKSGLAAVKFLSRQGASVRVTDSSSTSQVRDCAAELKRSGFAVEVGGHTEEFLAGSELVVTSPGVPRDTLPFVWARKNNIPVVSEIEIASLFCEGRILAVTGSNGKTTSSHLLHRILQESGKKSVLCGNVGYSFLDALDEIDSETFVVLELSSFQLEDCATFKPSVALLLNLSQNHLDRHKTMEAYAAAKAKIFQNQTGEEYLVANHEDALVRRLVSHAKPKTLFFSTEPIPSGVYLDQGSVRVRWHEFESWILDTSRLRLVGRHNLQNILACVAVASILRLPVEGVQRAIDSFETLEHRIEPLGECGGVRFFNDSKSTTLESTKAALCAVNSPIVLIAGGRDKGADFEQIEPTVKDRVRAAVLYGEARRKIASAWKNFSAVIEVENFSEAVHRAFATAKQGDSILLSPMCTSFDQFKSFEERGDAFKKIVRQIKTESASTLSVTSKPTS